MKTKEQIEGFETRYGNVTKTKEEWVLFDKEARIHNLASVCARYGETKRFSHVKYSGFMRGYEQAQKDAQEREAKLLGVIIPILEITDRKHDLWERAREVLKELGIT